MKAVRFTSIIILLSIAIVSCVNGSDTNVQDDDIVVSKNAAKTIIVDVRSTEEWNQDGHADCTVNYPLDQLSSKVDTLKGYDKIIVVCRSGSRAGAAKNLLEQAGIRNIENNGSWQNIDCK
ncbi:MAG: rhodanese-like domain-containing protein [Chitinophagaceae bacterium]|nr:rhodanese-like domain-containing protein [Chitinophagaceae bacterium]